MILIGFGTNSPFCGLSRETIIREAIVAVRSFACVKYTSRLYESPAWPDQNDPLFLNAVAEIETDLLPKALMSRLLYVERAFGRDRSGNARRYGPRTLDIDLLAFNDVVMDGDVSEAGPQVEAAPMDGAEALVLPHPRIAERDFVLAPLAEIAPEWRHPITGATAEQMLDKLSERRVTLFEEG